MSNLGYLLPPSPRGATFSWSHSLAIHYFSLVFQSVIEEDNMNDVSIMSFTPTVEDEGKYLTCRAENPSIENSALEDKWRLDVHCEYIYICVCIWHAHTTAKWTPAAYLRADFMTRGCLNFEKLRPRWGCV